MIPGRRRLWRSRSRRFSGSSMVANRVSCVVELLVRRTAPEDLDRLTAAADVRVVLTTCSNSMDRFADRNRHDPLVSRPAVLRALGFADIGTHTDAAVRRMQEAVDAMRVEFDLPTLVVATDDGFDPPLDDVVAFATRPAAPPTP